MTMLRFGIALVLGGVFLFAGNMKSAAPHEAVLAVAAFHLIPESMALILGIILPGIEVVIGAALVCGYKVRAASLGAAVLCIIFAIAISYAMIYQLDLNCGCFGKLSKAAQADFKSLSFDLTLLACALYLVKTEKD